MNEARYAHNRKNHRFDRRRTRSVRGPVNLDAAKRAAERDAQRKVIQKENDAFFENVEIPKNYDLTKYVKRK